jgi:hypothetical protein
MKTEKKLVRSVFLFMICLILNEGCQHASPIVSQAPEKETVVMTSFPPTIDSDLTISSETPDTLEVDTVASDALFKSGFVGVRETYRNRLSTIVQIRAQLLASSVSLSTRIQEVAVIGSMQGAKPARTFMKSTQVELSPTELRFQRNGEQRIAFVNGIAAFDLASGETLSVEWVFRASTDVDLCPFRAQQSFPSSIMPNLGSSLQWSFVGSNLFGSVTRSIEASLSSGATAVLVSSRMEPFNLSAGVSPSASDRPLGCNGLMQSLPSP